MKSAFLCEQSRNRGFAAARRPPQNHRGKLFCIQHAPQRPAFSQQMILPDDVGKTLRPQPVGKRSGFSGFMGEKRRHALIIWELEYKLPAYLPPPEGEGISGRFLLGSAVERAQ